MRSGANRENRRLQNLRVRPGAPIFRECSLDMAIRVGESDTTGRLLAPQRGVIGRLEPFTERKVVEVRDGWVLLPDLVVSVGRRTPRPGRI